jgi:lipase
VTLCAEQAAASQALIANAGHLMLLEQLQAFLAAMKRALPPG